MPNFAPSEEKVARVALFVKPAGVTCTIELYLVQGSTKVASSGQFTFVSTGVTQDILFPITMPSAEGDYAVWLDIFAGGFLIAGFVGTEGVVISVGAVEQIEIIDITVTPTELTDTQYEYNTYLGLGFWGDPFTIGITYKNPFPYSIWVRPDFAFGKLTGEPLEYVDGVLQGFDAKSLIYVRLLLDSPAAQGDYSYTSDWQKLYNEQNAGSNMPQFVYDPDGIAVLAAGGDCWLKVPALGTATTVKQAHLGTDITAALPDVFDLCVVANKAFRLVYEPHYRTVGGVQYLINWKSVALDPTAVVIPGMVSVGPAPDAVTIDVLEVRINYTSRSATVKVAITNNTEQTLTETHKFWVRAFYGERFVRPALGKSAAVTFQKGDEMVLLYSTTQTRDIGSIPPGTTIKTLSYSDGFGSIIYINSSSVVSAYPLATALPEGLLAYAAVHFGAPDGVPIADADAGFKGELSSLLIPWEAIPFELQQVVHSPGTDWEWYTDFFVEL